MNIAHKLANLRMLMREHRIDYYLVPGTDPHQSEYPPALWERRAYISGFDGSNGDALIGLNQAYLWTDGRYTLQAEKQLDPQCFKAIIDAQGGENSLSRFFETLKAKIRLGVDPTLLSLKTAQKLENALHPTGSELVYIPENLVDAMTGPLPFSAQPIDILDLQYTGVSTEDKIKTLRAHLNEKGIDAIVLSDLPSIAWLLNLRGHDINFNPLFLSYAIVSTTELDLYLYPEALTPALNKALTAWGVRVKPYSRFYADLATLPWKKIELDPKASNQAIKNALQANTLYFHPSPISLWKAIKNKTEIAGAIEAHRLDALALCQFFSWIETHWKGLSEADIAEHLLRFRSAAASFKGESFTTIAGYADNGAIIHYHPHKGHDKAIGDQALLLIDSGGQYLEGTTDITRTIHLGTPTLYEQECYTRVLKGHLALQRTRFPQGTRGEQLDVLARQFLWQEGLNYAHGTGHGVGAYLCVHEGPQRISTATTETALSPGMIVSNEPGLYIENKFGIRIENLVVIIENSNTFCQFENLTRVPYSRKLLALHLLTEEERTQINAYHAETLKLLSPDLTGDTFTWLKTQTEAL